MSSSTRQETPNIDGFKFPDLGGHTAEEAAANMIETLTGLPGPSQPPTDRRLRDFVVFVSPAGKYKRICRHTFMADDRDAAAKHVAEHCTLAQQGDVEVEVFVHGGIVYRYQLVKQEGKR